ncbi:MAG: hypothetical protein AABY22_14815 [Nanoarchaeota archaeon]
MPSATKLRQTKNFRVKLIQTNKLARDIVKKKSKLAAEILAESADVVSQVGFKESQKLAKEKDLIAVSSKHIINLDELNTAVEVINYYMPITQKPLDDIFAANKLGLDDVDFWLQEFGAKNKNIK